jgi:hypothetical protein
MRRDPAPEQSSRMRVQEKSDKPSSDRPIRDDFNSLMWVSHGGRMAEYILVGEEATLTALQGNCAPSGAAS